MKLSEEQLWVMKSVLMEERAGRLEQGQPFQVTDSWISLHDDNGETHCYCCGKDLYEGDPCLAPNGFSGVFCEQ